MVLLEFAGKMGDLLKAKLEGYNFYGTMVLEHFWGGVHAFFVQPILRALAEDFFGVTLQLALGDIERFGQSSGSIASLTGYILP